MNTDRSRTALSRPSARAYAALTAAGVLWGTTVPLSKLALEWLPPAWLTFVRFGVAAVLLIPAARGTLRRACTPAVLASGALGYGASVIAQNAGIARTSVSHAALLVGAVPVLVAVISAVWHRAAARPLAWVGFAVSLAGVGLIAGSRGGGATLAGDGLVLVSALLSATAMVAQNRMLRDHDPVAMTAAQFLGAALAALPAALTEGIPPAPTGLGAALAVIGLAAGGTAVPFTLYAYGQSIVPAAVAGAFVNLEPLVGTIAGIVFFANPAGLAQVAGGTAILCGIGLSSYRGRVVRLRAAKSPAVGDDRAVEVRAATPAAAGDAERGVMVRRVSTTCEGMIALRGRNPACDQMDLPPAAGLACGAEAARGRGGDRGRCQDADRWRRPRRPGPARDRGWQPGIDRKGGRDRDRQDREVADDQGRARLPCRNP
jgi:O-acetylserine/cysteine efflux transporter